MTLDQHLLLFLIAQVLTAAVTAVGIYGAIRADLARASEQARSAAEAAREAKQAAVRAHSRIDALLSDR